MFNASNWVISEDQITHWEVLLGDYVFVISMGFLVFELLRYALSRRLSINLVGDTLANLVTFLMYLAITYGRIMMACGSVTTRLYVHLRFHDDRMLYHSDYDVINTA